ncbi:MAG: hypothetical protein INR71_04060 [Terriglobus roseus]|nr:hypothetical protein [Terriglobus roseus]
MEQDRRTIAQLSEAAEEAKSARIMAEDALNIPTEPEVTLAEAMRESASPAASYQQSYTVAMPSQLLEKDDTSENGSHSIEGPPTRKRAHFTKRLSNSSNPTSTQSPSGAKASQQRQRLVS